MTKASGPRSGDAEVGPELLAGEDGPREVLADSAYGSGQARADLTAGHDAVIKPGPLRPAVENGFTIEYFTVNPDERSVTCPNGVTRKITASRTVTFGAACKGCPLRGRCTTSVTGRSMSVHEHDALPRAARRQAETQAFQQVYRQHRPMVERSIAWLARGNRKVRYRSVGKNDHWLHLRVAGLNLRRLLNLGLTRTDGTWAITAVNPTTTLRPALIGC